MFIVQWSHLSLILLSYIHFLFEILSLDPGTLLYLAFCLIRSQFYLLDSSTLTDIQSLDPD